MSDHSRPRGIDSRVGLSLLSRAARTDSPSERGHPEEHVNPDYKIHAHEINPAELVQSLNLGRAALR
jgi:hypothetical protein